MQERPDSGLTRYVSALGRGESAVGPQAQLFAELHAIAQAYMRGAQSGVTLQPTVLVNEAYLKLFDGARADWSDRAHFFAVAAKAMRQILVDRARAKASLKRGGALERITLADHSAHGAGVDVDLIDLDDALTELARDDEQAARVIELRFFAGLEMEGVAKVLKISLSTAEREWRAARAWLGIRLNRGASA